jgi:hypothetical protein
MTYETNERARARATSEWRALALAACVSLIGILAPAPLRAQVAASVDAEPIPASSLSASETPEPPARPALGTVEPALLRARAAYDDADFARALAALDEVPDSGPLTLAELVQYLELRAFVGFATGDDARTQAALDQLASIDPDYALPSSAPPPVVETFARLRSERVALSMVTEARPEPGALHLQAAVRGDPSRSVLRVTLRARPEGGSWQTARGDTLDLVLPDGGTMEYYAEALGLGGAVLSSAGSAAEPRTATVPPLHAPADDTALHWGLVLGSVGVVAVAIGIALGVTLGSTDATTLRVTIAGF